MIVTILTAVALIGLSSAQSTVSLFIPDTNNDQNLVGSVVGSSGSATTYAIQCAPGTDSSNCGFQKLSQSSGALRPSTSRLACQTWCAVSGSTSAVCVESATGSSANFPGVITTTLASSEIGFVPVVITAGPGISAQPSATVTSSADRSSTSSASSTTSTGKAAGPGGSSSNSGSVVTSTSAKSSSSATSTGGSTASPSSSANVTAATQTKSAGTMQVVGGSGKGAMGAIAVVLAMAMTML